MGTATTIASGKVFLPGAEFVRVTFTSGDTYRSKKFRQIKGAIHGGIQGSTSTSDTLTVNLGTTDTSTITLMSNATATSLSTCLVVWGIH